MAKFNGFGGFGGNNMQALMKQAQKMQEDALKAKAEVENSTHEGEASGGLVKATVNGNGKLIGLEINPSVVDADDVEMLEDLIIAAYNSASDKAESYKNSKLGAFGGLM